jgi:hypothetical protein
MAKYTTELRSICETLSGFGESKGYADVDSIISIARPKIFAFSYPIFDEAYKTTLETKILEAYYTREIAHETVGLWKLKLQTKMRQIMPYYNQLYKSTLLEFNPLYDVNLTHSRTATNEGTKVTAGTTIQGTTKKETGTIDNNEVLTNTGTVKNSGTVKDTGTIGNNGTFTDSGTVMETGTIGDNSVTTNDLTDRTVIDGTNVKTITGDHKDAYSDTPQNGLTDVDNNNYLTNYRKITDGSTDTDNLNRTDMISKTGTINNTNTKTNDLTTTNDLTKTSSTNITNDLTKTNDITIANDLTNQKNGTITNNLTTDIDDTVDISNKDTINNLETYVETVMGKQGGDGYADLLLKFRKTFLNIDILIIEELSELFFTLW